MYEHEQKDFYFPPVKLNVKFTMQMDWNDLQFIITQQLEPERLSKAFILPKEGQTLALQEVPIIIQELCPQDCIL